jgi:hypothetical protein
MPFCLYGVKSAAMTRRILLPDLAVVLAGPSLVPRNHLHADARGPQSLTALVSVQSLTRDTNGDGLADAVAARVIVPASPTIGEVEAATNLAARLGYETTALTLPLVLRDGEVTQPGAVGVPILVGRANRFVQQLVDTHAVDVAALKPGQGLIAAVAAPLGGGDGIVVVGGDDEGTLNAGIELAARLPRVWGMNGITLPAVEEQAVRYLRAQPFVDAGGDRLVAAQRADRARQPACRGGGRRRSRAATLHRSRSRASTRAGAEDAQLHQRRDHRDRPRRGRAW